MPNEAPVDYNDFVSQVASTCVLFVEPAQIPTILKLLAEKSSGMRSWLRLCYDQMFTPSEAATEIINELVLTQPRLQMLAKNAT
jgi:hypothetical protein